MKRIGGAVWPGQWAAVLAIPIWWVIGSSLTGGGWNTLFVMILAVPTFLLLLIGPIVGTAARRYRSSHQMPFIYSLFTLVLWTFALIWPLTVTSGGDEGPGPSALGSLGVPESVAGGLGVVFLAGFFVALLCALVSLIAAGAVGARSTDVAPLPVVMAPPVTPAAAPAAPTVDAPEVSGPER